MLSFSVRASFWIVTAKQLLLIKLYIFGLCVYCNKKCLPCIISSVNFTFQRRAQVKFAMTYRSVHRVSQQFAGSIVVRPTDWKWIDIAFITESLNSFSLTLGYQWYQFDMIWYTSIIHAMCSEVELWLLTRCHWWIGINQTSQIQHNEQIICGHCTY